MSAVSLYMYCTRLMPVRIPSMPPALKSHVKIRLYRKNQHGVGSELSRAFCLHCTSKCMPLHTSRCVSAAEIGGSSAYPPDSL